MAGRKAQEFRPNGELSKVCQEMWDKDVNRLEPGVDYTINLQGGTKAYWREDKARDPLFSTVDETVLQRPTFKRFIALLDNYETSTGVDEVVTAEEVTENQRFIDAIMDTEVMKFAHNYLVAQHKAPADERKFKHFLYDTWFKLYRRTKGSRAMDSSAFEHVFVGETRGQKDVIGFHNWIQFYLQEKAGNVDYQGYIINKKPEEGARSHLITIKFKWNRETKPCGSTFMGTSPEFEVALYTVLFLCGVQGGGENHIVVNGYDVIVTVYRHGANLGTSFPKEHC